MHLCMHPATALWGLLDSVQILVEAASSYSYIQACRGDSGIHLVRVLLPEASSHAHVGAR